MNNGATQTFAIAPNTGCHIANVTVDGASVGAVAGYTFSNVAANHTIAATFALNTFTITATAGANGAISPSGTVAVVGGATQTFTIAPNTGCTIASVTVDGTSVGAVASYTFSNVTANHTIAATFTMNTFTIASTAGPNGAISPSGTVTVAGGATQTFSIAPNTGCTIASVTVDGTSVGAVASYTFPNVTANHTIAATFTLNTFTVASTAGPNGAISPSGAVTVNGGASRSFTIAPNTAWHIASVMVDGVSVGAVAGYMFYNISANHTIAATFALNTFTITATAGANGAISPSGAVTVNIGATKTFTIAPNTGYSIAAVTVDGVSVGAVASYTFSGVMANHTISASFAQTGQNPGSPPIAEAGPTQEVAGGADVTLNASNSRAANGSIASYQWTQTAGTPIVIANPAAAQTGFTAPAVGPAGAALTFEVTVTDSAGLSAVDTCIVNVVNADQPPDAIVGPDQTASPYSIVTLDGSQSTDPEGSGLAYQWQQIGGTAVVLSTPQSAKPTFVAPEVNPGGTALVFQLTVTDGWGLESTQTSIVNVTSDNVPPVAVTGANRTTGAGAVVTLDGSNSSDSGGGIASYWWRQTSGFPVTLSDPRIVKPTFTAPAPGSDPGPLTFELTVTDTGGLKARAVQTVTVQ